MKRACLFLLLASSFAWAGAPEIVTLPLQNSSHITLKVLFETGSVDDPKDHLGLTYLTARNIVDGGTQSMSKQQIDDLLYPFAASFNVRVDKDVTTFSTTFHKDHLEQVYPIFRDLFLAPRFDDSDFSRIKKATLKTITESIPDNNDERFSKRALDTLLFADHPYATLVEGDEAGVKKIEKSHVERHYAGVFNKNRMLLGIAGSYDDAMKARFLADFDKLPKGQKRTTKLPEVRMPNGIEALIVSKPRAFGSAIFMGYPLDIDRASDEFAALMVANSYLGEHRKSYGRLYRNMRSKRSLNYGDYSYLEWYADGHATQLPYSGYTRRQNFFSIWIRPVQIAEQFQGVEGLEPPELGNALHSIRQSLRELDMLVSKGMQKEDFERSRQFLMGYLKLFVQTQSERLGFLMDSRFHGRKDYINEMIALLDKLTLDDVNNAIKKHLQAKNMFVAVITDDSEAEKLADSLKNNRSAPIVYKPIVRDGLGEEILAEDKEIDAYKLNVTSVKVIGKDEVF